MPGNEGTRNRSMLEQLLDRSKRNGSSKTAAKEGSKTKTSERGVDDKEEFHQLRREFRQLEETRAELLEKENELEEQLRSLRREMEQVQRNSLPKRERLEAVCNAREVENARHLGKLPKEVWEKIADELDENDLFPLALSCKNFRQKQKELVARTRKKKNGSKRGRPRRALRTNLRRKLDEGQPASLEYLQFCSEEKLLSGEGWKKTKYIKCLAAYHGYLPLLQELQGPSWTNDYYDERIARAAGKSLSHSIFYLFCFGF